MLTPGTKIQTDADGGARLVEDLMIGERVYNPLSGTLEEIIDILSRTKAKLSIQDIWQPVKIPNQTLGKYTPSHDLIVSKRQELMWKTAPKKCRFPEVTVSLAQDIECAEIADLDTVTFFALFLENKMPLIANNVPCMGFSNHVFSPSG